ncbi:DUF3047 domain-containing protein [Nereida sp. MMG025]|uniref:DUF3047 domain-containing protein n=1 Tax=Nereida sp. MMG025 TaxID=2909981 RepID=UPI001F283B33|nr:DUF3047 domain-containing protein [Nereida sp. MMG025]MCF6443331.1 DUF3047 domain-containing protein [Nereida sp. MMG025]
MRLAVLSTALILSSTVASHAAAISLSDGWTNQRVSIFSKNTYSFGSSLGITSDDAISIAWRRLPSSVWDATRANWSWSVDQSVPATNLARKGGDDRNISIYFLFAPDDQARALSGAGIRKLLSNKDVRVLQYAWGGNHGRGAVLQSPYAPGQAVTVALRQAGTGQNSESVNLASDYARAFGGAPGKLLGMAVSADSDDTDSMIRASISNMRLQ